MQIRFLLSLLFISLLLSCKKEPLLNVYSDSVSFCDKGGSQSVSFVTNNEWSASVAGGSWLSLSRRSGDPGNASLSVSADVNDSFEERSGTITISSGPLSKTIAVSQVKNRGVIITNKQYEVHTEGGDIKVEVKSNVDFETLIPDDSKGWISALSTKGLVGNSFDFRISANPTNNNRIGKIVFKDKNSDVSDTVRVIQAQKDAIILTQRNYSISDTAIVINVELKSNVQYMVTIPLAVQSWVSQVGTKAMKTENLSFGIAANTSRQSRYAEIIFLKSLTTISDTLKITQAEVPLSPTVTTKSASAIKPYSAVLGGIVTDDGGAPVLARGLCWSVSPNPTVSNFKSNNGSGNGSFESEITGLNPDTKYYVRAYATNRAGTSYGNEVSFITADTSHLKIVNKESELLMDGGIIKVEVETNVNFIIIIPEESSEWIDSIEPQNSISSYREFKVSGNETGIRRVGQIIFIDFKNKIKDTHTVYQSNLTNSLQLLINDMSQPHEGIMSGVPPHYDWYSRPVIHSGNTPPNNWLAMIPWGQIYSSILPFDKNGIRVQIRNLQAWYLNRNNQWLKWVQTSAIEGKYYREDFSEDYNLASEIRIEPSGGISTTMKDGYVFHFWPQVGRIAIDRGNINGIWICFEARVISDFSDYEKLDNARFLVSSGGDYWIDFTSPKIESKNNIDIGVGRAKYLSKYWKCFNMHTLSLQQLKNYPPPL